MSSHQASLAKDRPLTSADRRAGDAAAQLRSLVQQISLSATHSEAEDRVHVLLMLSQAANGLLHLLAKFVVPVEERDNPITSTATLFAALMSYHIAPFETETGKAHGEFSPLVLFDALKDAEKLNGQRPDDLLDETMCRVARECAANPAMVAQIAQERNIAYRGGATLN